MSSQSSSTVLETVHIDILQEGGIKQTRPLPEGKVFMVGSATHHALCLTAEGVAPTHCMLSVRDGQVHIRDWNSPLGTFLNHSRIEVEAIAKSGDVIGIGRCQIRIGGASGRGSQEPAPVAIRPAPVRPQSPPELDMGSKLEILLSEIPAGRDAERKSAHTIELSTTARSRSSQTVTEGPHVAVDELPASNLDEWFTDLEPDDPAWCLAADQDDVPALKRELALRDARIAELESLAGRSSSWGESESNQDASVMTERLSSRLEQVLAELECSDERVATLTEILARTEEASRAALEERSQVENWIGEIERLFSTREAEWHAERDVLRKRIEQITSQRDSLETRIGHAVPGAQTGPQVAQSSQAELLKIRQEMIEIRRTLATVSTERDSLATELNKRDPQQIEDRLKAQFDAQLREAQLQLAEEKSEFARSLAATASSAAESAARGDVDPRAADYRIRAFREHLREVHATEPKVPHERDSMSHRLGRIWRKLNGTPLDTD